MNMKFAYTHLIYIYIGIYIYICISRSAPPSETGAAWRVEQVVVAFAWRLGH